MANLGDDMPIKKRGTKIKQSRLKMILKSRKMTIKKLAAEIGYNRRSLNYAIVQEYMDHETLKDICKYLNVSPAFISGSYPLRKFKTEFSWLDENKDPSGYDVPTFEDWEKDQEADQILRDLLSSGPDKPYFDLLLKLADQGIDPTPETEGHKLGFTDSFVFNNAGFLIPPIKSAVNKTVFSAMSDNDDYKKWLSEQPKTIPDSTVIFEYPEEPAEEKQNDG